MERKGKAVEGDGISWVALGQIVGAIFVIVGYGYYLLFTVPQRWEQRRLDAMVAMQVESILMTPTFESNGGEVIAVYGVASTPAPVSTAIAVQVSPTPFVVPSVEPTVQVGASWDYRQVVDPLEHCFDCTVYEVPIMVTHYWPNAGSINCWTYNEENKYCESATTSGLPWEYFVGIGAACPLDWPLGSWVEIPNYGTLLCVDRGSMKCEHGVCEVDILARDIGAIDKTIQDAKIYINWGSP